MGTDFKELYDSLQTERKDLELKTQAAKQDAIKHVQELIDAFNILSTDVRFEAKPARSTFRSRKPPRVKYRTPTGIEWSGMGKMKKEFRDYLISEGLTEEDTVFFLVEEEK